jgi:hypothetical protein
MVPARNPKPKAVVLRFPPGMLESLDGYVATRTGETQGIPFTRANAVLELVGLALELEHQGKLRRRGR